MSLRLKANLLFVASTLLLLLIAILSLRAASHDDVVDQARREATLVTDQMQVVDRYTAEKIAPLLSGGQFVFVPAGTPFSAAQTQAQMLEAEQPGLSIRQVVLDPVGAGDRPADWERKAIDKLRSEPHPEPFTVERDDGNGPRLALLTPLLFAPGICATCYTSRAAAPAGILDAFGGYAGFDRKPGEIVGVTVASVPLPASHLFTVGVIWLVVLALALIGLFNLLLELLLLRPLGRVAAVAERISLGQTGVEEFDTAGNDEVGSIARSFNRLRRSMESAIGLIES